MTTALVLGCNGFCGRSLSAHLGRREHVRVAGADVQPSALVDVAEYAQIDLRDEGAVAELLGRLQPEWIFNLAGVARGSLRSQLEINLLGTVKLLDAVRERAPEARVILAGSAAEYGLVPPEANPIAEDRHCEPVGAYAVSKHSMTLAALDHAREYGTRVLVMRPFNVVGPGTPPHLVLGALLARAKRALAEGGDPVIKIGNLHARRDFIAVDDVVRCYVLAAESGLSGEVINVCSGRTTQIKALVETALSFAPVQVRLEVDPALLRPSDAPEVCGDPTKARRLLGFEAEVALDQSLREAWNAASAN